jgi:hypothetical protein
LHIENQESERRFDDVTDRSPAAAILGFLLPFSLVAYVAIRGGGYDPITLGEFGVVVWWLVLLGSAVGLLSTTELSRSAWVLIGLFGAYLIWIGLSIIWTESTDRAVVELARASTYFGVLALGLTAGTAASLRRTLAGVGAGLAFVALLALASRLHPAWFPENSAADVLPETVRRLNYPVGYWNGLAALVAIGLPLVLWLAAAATRAVVRVLAAVVVPAMALTVYLTVSRGGALEVAVCLVAFVSLYPRRLTLLPTLATTGLGSAILVWAASRREDLANGLSTSTAATQADQMILIVLAVCAAVGLVQWAILLAGRRTVGQGMEVSRPTALRLLGAAAVIVVLAGLAAGASGWASDRWQEFKAPAGPTGGDSIERFSSASGNGRYQYWSESVGGEPDPLIGTGPGTWEFTWARDGTLPGFVRDAHSLYFQTFVELGAIGLILMIGIVSLVVVVAVRRALVVAPGERAVMAAAAAAFCTFAVATLVDWAWQLPVLPVSAFLIAAAVLTVDRRGEWPARQATMTTRLAIPAVALVGALAVAVPLPAAISIRSSQDSVNTGDLPGALDQAETAQKWEPYAAAPRLQEALVLERLGELRAARDAAAEAVSREGINWRNWLVLSRLEARLGNAEASIAAYRRARELNPRSPLFAQ